MAANHVLQVMTDMYVMDFLDWLHIGWRLMLCRDENGLGRSNAAVPRYRQQRRADKAHGQVEAAQVQALPSQIG